jgi:Transposase
VEVAIGVDPAKGSLAVAAVDPLGKVLDAREFSNDPTGHQALLGWVRERGPDRVIGIECSLSYGAYLSRLLLGAGEDVREVPTTLTHRERGRERPGASRTWSTPWPSLGSWRVPLGLRDWHSWVETGGMVYDDSNGARLENGGRWAPGRGVRGGVRGGKTLIEEVESFYNRRHVQRVRRYTALEVARHMIRTGHFEVWEPDEENEE